MADIRNLILLRNDPDEALRLLAEAEQGDLDAQYAMGLIYAEGRGLPQDEARAFMKVVFADGEQLSDDVLNSAVDVDRRYRERLLTKFKETGKYGQLDDGLATTCIFGDAKIDPNADSGITENFKTVFTGTGEVHALCRIPAPAEKYGGDPNGQVTIVIDDDDDTANGVVHRGELGPPEKWGSTQWFSGRFSMPQGKYATKDSGYYRVFIEVVRPEMGDEKLVENSFYWHR